MTTRDGRVAVTGIGVVSPIGEDVASFTRALREGRDGIRTVTRFSTEAYDRHLAGTFEHPRWDELARRVLADPNAVDPVAVAGTMALREAFESAALKNVAPERIALVVGSTAGALTTRSAYEFTPVDRADERAVRFERTHMRTQTAHLANALGLRGPWLTVSTACASATNAIAHASDLLRGGYADVAIAGGMDFLVEEMFCGFFAMDSMSAAPCAPFSEPRGMNVGEGAGFLVLERCDDAVARGARIRAFVAGYGLSLDAFHAMSPDPTGAGGARALRSAIDHAGIAADRVSYVNAHGTGTEANDPAEWSSIQRALGTAAVDVPVSSTKSYFGHALGAAGALEIAATILCREEGTIPPTLHFTGSRGAVPKDPVGENRPRAHAWTFAAKMNSAFGGANATVLLGAADSNAPSFDTAARNEAPLSELQRGTSAAVSNGRGGVEGRRVAGAEDALVIVGVGVVAGHGYERFDDVLARGTPLCTRVDSRREGAPVFAARVPEFDLEAIVRGIDARGIDAPARMLTLAAHAALRDAKLKLSATQRDRLGLFCATAAPGWDTTAEFWGSIRARGYPKVSTPAFSRVVINAAVGAVSRMLGIRGPGSVFAGGVGSTLAALVCAGELLRGHRDADLVVVGGVYDVGDEVLVHEQRRFREPPSTSRGFPAYGEFEPRPFAGEGAVSVLLTRAQNAPAPPIAHVLGASLGPPGALDVTIRDAIARAGSPPGAIDLVYGSADGTIESGARELLGCESALGRRPAFANPTTLVGRTGIADGFALAAAAIALRASHGFTVDGERIPVRTVLVISDDAESGCMAVVLRSHSAEDSPHG